MRYYALALVLLLLCAGLAQAQERQPDADNTLPLYGGRPYNACQTEANRKFIEAATKAAGTREKAAEAAVRRGFDFLRERDTVTAIKRFNQAWLLNPENPDAYWGLGIATGRQGKYDESVRMFAQALALAPDKPQILADAGFAHMWRGVNVAEGEVRQAEFAAARRLLDTAEKQDQRFAPLYFFRAMLCFFEGDYAASWRDVARAEALNPREVDPRFLRDLSAKMPRPRR